MVAQNILPNSYKMSPFMELYGYHPLVECMKMGYISCFSSFIELQPSKFISALWILIQSENTICGEILFFLNDFFCKNI